MARRWLLSVTAVLSLAGMAVLWQAAFPRAAHVEKPPRLIFELVGPNDGEPINSRYLALECATNYVDRAILRIHVNGDFLFSRPLAVDLRPDGRPNVFRTDVDIDLEQVYRVIDRTIFDPDAPPLRVTASLYADGLGSSRLLTFAEWSGYVQRPWIEFLSLNYARDGGGGREAVRSPTEPPDTLQILIHPLPADSYYFLLASTDRSLLTFSPEEARVHLEATFISSGRCSAAAANNMRKVIYVDVEQDLPGPPAYMVLWTFDSYRGWKRSPIILIAQ